MTRNQAFKAFLKCFSEESLPITLSEENTVYFSSKNPPIPQDLIRMFIFQGEKKTIEDDFTEYVACCKIPLTGDIHAIVYWKGGLMQYDYILSTFNKNGVLISKKIIAGTRSDGSSIFRSVATIDEDWIINIIVGEQGVSEKHYDPLKSQNMTMELLINGDIIFSLKEQN